MKHIITNDKRCTGCSACVASCSKNCVKMVENKEGFLYPTVDEKICINCGACSAVCSINVEQTISRDDINVFLCFSKNKDIKKNSSSGGMFYELGKYIIDREGCVYGAKYTDDFKVIHSVARSENELFSLMKSKYIQSEIGNTYVEIKNNLKNNRIVMFVGTPCQVKGLKLFLKSDYENLFCGEVVCHGVPSYKVLKKYTDYISGGAALTCVDFRDKSSGWKDYNIKFEFDNGIVFSDRRNKCLYFNGYIDNLFLRKSCYSCNCKYPNSFADFTIGDFWGIDSLIPERDDDTGVSLFITNNKKGEQIFNEVKHRLFIEKLEDNRYLDFNPSIRQKAIYNNRREAFFDNFDKYNFGDLWDYVYSDSIMTKLKIKLKSKLKM